MFLGLSIKKLWAAKQMWVQYAKIEKRVLNDFRIYSTYRWMKLKAPSLQANEGSLSLHTWLEGSLSPVGSVCGINVNTKSARESF